MSSQNSNNSFDGLFINISLLREHISDITVQKNNAELLLEKIKMLRNLDDTGDPQLYRIVISKTDSLVQYYKNLIIILEKAETDALQLVHDIGNLIQNNTESVSNTINDNFLV